MEATDTNNLQHNLCRHLIRQTAIPRAHHPLAATTAARSVVVVHTHHSQCSCSAATLIVVVLRAKPDL